MKSKLESLFIILIAVLSIVNVKFCADAINKLTDSTERTYISQDDIKSKQYLVTDEYISRISPKTTVESFMMELGIENRDVKIYEDETKENEIEDGLVKTGMVMTVEEEEQIEETIQNDEEEIVNEEVEGIVVEEETNEEEAIVEEQEEAISKVGEYVLSVVGDINSDGNANIVEVVQIINHLAKFEGKEIEGIRLISSDVNGDDEVNLIDVDKLIRYIVFEELEIGEVGAPDSPEITAEAEGNNGWFREDTKVTIKTMAKEDNFKKTVYVIDGEKFETTKQEETKVVKQNGEHKIKAYTYGAKDNKSIEVEKEIRIDKELPTVNVVKEPEETTEDKVVIRINAEDNLSGLEEEAYSFDGGLTWEEENEKEYTQNQTVVIKVRDKAGNIAEEEIVIDNIETEATKYTITFKNYDGEILQEEELEEGTIPEYRGETPTRERTEEYTYEFAGWDKEITEVRENKEYIATYREKTNKYTVTFYDEDGETILGTSEVNYGENVTYNGEVPTKQADNTYTYTFVDWYTRKEEGQVDDLSNVTSNRNVYARYNAEYINYTVVFKNDDGTELSRKEDYHYGDEVVVPESPTKESTQEYTYEFTGWDKEVTNVTKNEEYTATYTETYKNYTIVFKDSDGTELSRKEDYHYGDSITSPEIQEKEQEGYRYTFSGWTLDGENIIDVDNTVIQEREYIAKYTREVIIYTITYDLNGGSFPEGTHNPEKYTVETETFTIVNPVIDGYSFGGWKLNNEETVNTNVTIERGSTGNRVYKATWTGANTVKNLSSDDGKEYPSISAALQDPEYNDGDILQIIADVLNDNITIDEGRQLVIYLNGKTISNNVNDKPTIVNNGTLTIVDDSANGTGKITSTSDAVIVNNGALTFGINNRDVTDTPYISGKNAGLVNNGTFDFYDGIVEATPALSGNGHITGTPTDYIATIGKVEGDENKTKLSLSTLAHVVAKVNSTGIAYASIGEAVDSLKSDTLIEIEKLQNGYNEYLTDGLVLELDGEKNILEDTHSENTNTWYDISGVSNKNAIIQTGNTKWDNDALVLDGSTYYNVESPLEEGYGTVEITVSIDEDFNPVNSSAWYSCSTIFGKELNGVHKDWGVIIDKNGYFAAGYAHSSICSSGIYALDGKIHTIGYSYLADKIVISVDGYVMATIEYTPSGDNIQDFGIGWNGVNTNTAVKGKIYSVRLYNKELTKGDFAQNRAIDKARFIGTRVASYDEVTPETITILNDVYVATNQAQIKVPDYMNINVDLNGK